MMKILVTGAAGFMGSNLIASIAAQGDEAIPYCHSDGIERLYEVCQDVDYVFHLAGVNRPKKERDFYEGNVAFTEALIRALEAASCPAPIVFSSSIQAILDNPYGNSKRQAEQVLLDCAARSGRRVWIYRLTNVFGKWCRPHYNSVVATFCHQIARGLPIQVNDPAHIMRFAYIDDVVQEFLSGMREESAEPSGFRELSATYTCTLGELAEWIKSFAVCRKTLALPDQGNMLLRHLYSTYLSYLPEKEFSYPLLTHRDARGSFTEFIRTVGQGQFSVNISHPHIVKGNHWHHSKHEKFLVVSGRGIIRFRKWGDTNVIEYPVSGDHLEVVEIPPGYTHNIENTGDTDMVTLMWANENFNPQKPDTYAMEV